MTRDNDRQRDADIRDLIAANCPPEEIAVFVGEYLRGGGRVILPCSCPSMITTRLDASGNMVVSHYSQTGKYEASTSIPAGMVGTPNGSEMLHTWIASHHTRIADQIGPATTEDRTHGNDNHGTRRTFVLPRIRPH